MKKIMTTDISKALSAVRDKIKCVSDARPKDLPQIPPRLVAVSKTKPPQLVVEAYNCGQKVFGENYVKELEAKGNDELILTQCKNIQWHFIGHLQRNSVNKLLGVPNLSMVETVQSEKLANALNLSWERLQKPNKLDIMVQVNTSGEGNKHGCDPAACVQIVDHILKKCPGLKFKGLMTIGAWGHDYAKGENPDFLRLIDCRRQVCETFGFELADVELSMGMSGDFEEAILAGSTNVRIGSTIFGARDYPQKDSGAPNDTLVNTTKNTEASTSSASGSQEKNITQQKETEQVSTSHLQNGIDTDIEHLHLNS